MWFKFPFFFNLKNVLFFLHDQLASLICLQLVYLVDKKALVPAIIVRVLDDKPAYNFNLFKLVTLIF